MEHIEDGVVAASGAPAGCLFILEIACRESLCHVLFHKVMLLLCVFNSIYNLLHEEGLSFHFVDAENLFARDVLLQIVGKHAGVKLCHDDSLEFLELVDSVFWERVDVAEMSESHRSAFGVKTVGGGKHMAVSSAPSNEHSVGLGIPLELELGDVVGDACDFSRRTLTMRSWFGPSVEITEVLKSFQDRPRGASLPLCLAQPNSGHMSPRHGRKVSSLLRAALATRSLA